MVNWIKVVRPSGATGAGVMIFSTRPVAVIERSTSSIARWKAGSSVVTLVLCTRTISLAGSTNPAPSRICPAARESPLALS